MGPVTFSTSEDAHLCEHPGIEEKVRDKFNETFDRYIIPSVSVTLLDSSLVGNDIEDSVYWLKNVMRKNVPHGKQKRGRMIELTYKQLVPNASEKQRNLARILGWCMEILQAGFLIADDIMDNGVTRRGRLCWYRENNMGNSAFNDTLMLEHVTYQLIHKFCSHLPMYTELIELIHRVCFQTTLGQSLDTRKSKSRNFDQFSESMYYATAQFKTGYYTCYLPIAISMLLAGYSRKDIKNQHLWKKMERITLEMGILFQVLDDYLDCYCSEEKLGKKGTDIEEGKCTWLFVTAKKLCTAEQLVTLTSNYGYEDPDKVSEVKRLYRNLNMPCEFQRFRDASTDNIKNEITTIEHDQIRKVLSNILQLICGK